MQQWILRLLLPLLFTACTSHLEPTVASAEKRKLYRQLIQTVRDIKPSEAKILSREAISYSKQLAARYEVTAPPLVHNFLVNVGIKKRGLCYQWSDDLYGHLRSFHFKSIQLKPLGANVGRYWSEHNALAVLPRGDSDLSHGLLLDAWRRAGTLYYTPITKDPEYTWRIRTDRCAVYQPK